MKYYSTQRNSPAVNLSEAVSRGLAPDGGLYMPERLPHIPTAVIRNMPDMSLQEIAFVVANTLFGSDIDSASLKGIVYDALNFPIPLKQVDDNIFVLEMFHGPTLAFKDVGARFMARMLAYFGKDRHRDINVLVATSGDTGSAVANGFLNVPGVNVYVLYPKGKVSKLQEAQFTTLGSNITAIEVAGTFDDCQAMVKSAFVDKDITEHIVLTSANSINPARFLPQMFYYFWAYASLVRLTGNREIGSQLVFCVPSGNLGNICSALIGNVMGMPVKRFIAANNANRVFTDYLNTGEYTPRPSIPTIANAMDVGAPSNFARILDLYGLNHTKIADRISGSSFTDEEIAKAIADTYRSKHYLLDPHGATGYMALKQGLQPGEVGIFLETAHPAKFREVVGQAIGSEVAIPDTLARFMARQKKSIQMAPTAQALKRFLLQQ